MNKLYIISSICADVMNASASVCVYFCKESDAAMMRCSPGEEGRPVILTECLWVAYSSRC